MTAWMLALRTARRYKARTGLAIAGVAIIGALNFDMLLLSRGLVLSFADLVRSGGFDIRITANGAAPPLRLPITDAWKFGSELERLPEVAKVAVLRIDQASLVGPDGAEYRANVVGTTETSGGAGWTLLKGRDLTGPSAAAPSAVVTRRLATALRIEPPASIRVRPVTSGERSVLPQTDFQVVGIAEFTFETGDEYTIITSPGGAQALRGGVDDGEAEIILVRSSPGAEGSVVASVRRLRPDLQVYTNDELVEQFNENSFAYFRQISTVLSTTTALFAFLLVATLLTVSVNQRLGEIAAFRAIGISERRVAAMLLWESALLVGVGGIVALPLGTALAQVFDQILRGIPGLPERLHFFVFSPRALVLHAALLVVTTIVAAAYPMWLAVTLPIAPTLRREIVS
jgi:putative ABC transport system permease protein